MPTYTRPVSAYIKSIGARGAPRQAQRLGKLLDLCTTLPEVTVAPWGDHLMVQVRKKTFAYYLNNHHGDGKVALCAKSLMPRQRELIAEDPDRYYSPAYLGVSGWVGARMDLPRVDWPVIKDLVKGAWLLQAPRKLAEQFAE